MKPAEIANLLEISSPTVRAWAAEYRAFLSPAGAGGDGRHRDFSEQDLQILYFVKMQKKAGLAPDDIHLSLKQLEAGNWDTLPLIPEQPNMAKVPMIPTAAANTALDAERRALLREIAFLQERIEDTQQRLDNRDGEIKDLTRALAEAQTELRLYRSGRLRPEE